MARIRVLEDKFYSIKFTTIYIILSTNFNSFYFDKVTIDDDKVDSSKNIFIDLINTNPKEQSTISVETLELGKQYTNLIDLNKSEYKSLTFKNKYLGYKQKYIKYKQKYLKLINNL
jgi:hypothetical protein